MAGSEVARWFAKIAESARSLDSGLSRKLDAPSLGMTDASAR